MFNYFDLTMLLIFPTILISIVLLILFLRRREKKYQQSTCREAIQLLILLRHLVASLQKHRGLSTGILRGDESLTHDLHYTRSQIDRFSDQCAQTSTQLRNNERWISLIDHWSRLRNQGHLDAENNLNQHNHMIRNLIFLIEDLATEFNLGAGKPQLSYLPFIWREILQTAEWAGQARALGPLHLLPVKTAVDAMLGCIEQELLNKEQPDISATEYFQNATYTIDMLLTLVDTALKHLQSIHREDAGTLNHLNQPVPARI